VERTLSSGSRQNFRTFLARYFVPETPPAEANKSVAGLDETVHAASR
jgi:hypothetical protein